jgi:hypothetical protein
MELDRVGMRAPRRTVDSLYQGGQRLLVAVVDPGWILTPRTWRGDESLVAVHGFGSLA